MSKGERTAIKREVEGLQEQCVRLEGLLMHLAVSNAAILRLLTGKGLITEEEFVEARDHEITLLQGPPPPEDAVAETSHPPGAEIFSAGS